MEAPMTGKAVRLAIVGRPNVGKSTLFNRLLGRRRALVHDEPGVTRDRLEEQVHWNLGGKCADVLLIDTGGLGGDRFADEIVAQVEIALSQADLVLVLFDAQSGLTPADEEVLRQLHRRSGAEGKNSRAKVQMIGVVNKVDAEVHEQMGADFFATGLDPILTISAEHGRGIDDLKEWILERYGERYGERFGEVETEESDEGTEPERHEEARKVPRIALVGRPNVGKSTLLNAVVGESRMITSPIAGTTVDAVDSSTELGGRPFVFVDTAGIRRKAKTRQGVEVLSVVQARKALERCDVAILLLDGEAGITDQDEKIGGLIEEAGCGVILAINKWDTQRANPKFTREMAAERVRKAMAYLKYAPILFVSAKEKEGIEPIGELVEEILRQRSVKIPTHEFTEWVREESKIHNPRNAKFYLCHQTGRNPPSFACHVNDPEKVHFSLKRHLLNALRERWGYMGNPIRLHFIMGKGKGRATR